MDAKLLIMLAAIAICAFLVGVLVSLGEKGDDGAAGEDPAPIQPPALPDDELMQAAENSSDSGLSDIFGNSNGIQPPALPN